MRLGLADEEVARRITIEPAFRGVNGQFDRVRFEQVIRQSGYTEQRYIAEQRRTSIRRQIATSITGGLPAPKTASEAFRQYENEERAIEYITLGAAQAGDLPKPTAEELAKYFEDRKTLFRAPEYRKLVVLPVTPDEIAKAIEVSDADIKRVYDDRRDSYATPERRHVQQIVFPNLDEAKKAAERISSGTGFAALAAERGLKDNDIDLGSIAKSGILDRAVADAAFALKEGAVSAPIQSRFGSVLVTVLKIAPEQIRPFEQIAADIKRDIAAERAKRDILDIQNKIEDERASGLRLDEVAQKLKLAARIIEAVDRSGRMPDGAQVTSLPEGADVLERAFTSDVGVEADPVQIAGGGYVWYEVTGITPSRERSLDEVKDRVEARWRDDEIAKRLKAKAADLTDKLKGGAALSQLASENRLTLEAAPGVKRRGETKIPARAVEQVFRTAKNTVGGSEGNSATEWIVFRVTDIVLSPFANSEPEIKRIDDTLRRSFEDDLIGQYIARLESDLGASINQNALRQATGASTEN
jgi:peptidyl-prolyl cis-trans isomerase D